MSERFALLSVSDKTQLVALAEALHAAGIGLLSTGGTATRLREAGLSVIDVSEHTGSAEMMAGRVKTLHPVVHGGILGRRDQDATVMRERGIAPIDYVVVNLYPFAETVARPDVSFDEAIENIDIGGPAMLRSAAKNHASVMVVTEPADYAAVIGSLQADAATQAALRFDLAVKAFEHTARYDGMIADYLGRLTARDESSDDAGAGSSPQGGSPDSHQVPQQDGSPLPGSRVAACFPRTLNRQFQLISSLRYGENPHQHAAFYRTAEPAPSSLAAARLLQGKALSYNNVMDTDAALACVRQFSEPACVIVKHANPCGVAIAQTGGDAYDLARRTDPVSAFGGILAFNRELDADTVERMLGQQFVEVIIAPGYAVGALDALAGKPLVRVLQCAEPASDDQGDPGQHTGTGDSRWQYRPVSGGVLVQNDDRLEVQREQLKVVSRRTPSAAELDDLMFAWRVAKFVKSNAIVYARDGATVGVGAGQMSRIYSARIAGIKAADEGLVVAGAVMASDAFFPFRDGIDNAAEAGIRAVIQPGGSRKDDEVIAAADEHDLAMVFTGVRHFRH